MRGAFNRLLEIRHGTRSVTGPPGVVYASDVPCRVVPQRKIDQGQFPFVLADTWITLDVVDLAGPLVLSPWVGAYFTDQLAADEVRWSPGPGNWYSVCLEELVEPDVGPDYWRYRLIPMSSFAVPPWLPPEEIPEPAPGPDGPIVPPGAACDLAAELVGFGDWWLSSRPGDESGWYVLTVDPGTPVRISFLGEVQETWRVDGFTNTVAGGPCAGESLGTLQYAGAGCISTGPPYNPGSLGLIVLQVTRGVGLGEPVVVHVRIESAECA